MNVPAFPLESNCIFIHTSISEILQSNTVVHQMQIDMFIQVRLKLTRLYLAEIKEAVVNFFSEVRPVDPNLQFLLDGALSASQKHFWFFCICGSLIQ